MLADGNYEVVDINLNGQDKGLRGASPVFVLDVDTKFLQVRGAVAHLGENIDAQTVQVKIVFVKGGVWGPGCGTDTIMDGVATPYAVHHLAAF